MTKLAEMLEPEEIKELEPFFDVIKAAGKEVKQGETLWTQTLPARLNLAEQPAAQHLVKEVEALIKPVITASDEEVIAFMRNEIVPFMKAVGPKLRWVPILRLQKNNAFDALLLRAQPLLDRIFDEH